MNIGQAIFELVTDSSKFDKGIDGAKGKVGSFGTVAAGVAGGALGALTSAMGEMGRMAAAEEVQIAQLSAALATAGLSYDKLGDSIEAKIEAQTKSFAFSDDTQRTSLARLVTVTKDTATAFALQAVAMDLARFKGIDLVSATEAVIAVTQGRYRALAALGITIDENMTKEEALGALQAQIAGQAEAYGKTNQASIDRMRIAIDNQKESIGGLVAGWTPMLEVTGRLGMLLPALTGIIGAVGKAGGFAAVGVRAFSLALRAIPFVAMATLAYVGARAIGELVERFDGFKKAFAVTPFGALFLTLQGLKDKFGALIPDMGKAGATAAETAKDFSKLGAAGKDAVFTVGGALTKMREMFKPSGVDMTEDFLKSIGADPELIRQARDAFYNEIGADEATRFKKNTDRAYKIVTESFKESDAYREAHDSLKNAIEMTEADFAAAARTLGKKPSDYMAELKQNVADVDKNLEHFSANIGKAIENARKSTTTNADSIRNVSDHAGRVHAVRDAWREATQALDEYNTRTARLPGGFLHQPARGSGGGGGGELLQMHTGGIVPRTGLVMLEKGETVIPASQSAITVSPSITLNYGGSSDAGTAGRLAQDVLDITTEQLRQQMRRIGAMA